MFFDTSTTPSPPTGAPPPPPSLHPLLVHLPLHYSFTHYWCTSPSAIPSPTTGAPVIYIKHISFHTWTLYFLLKTLDIDL